MESEPSARHAHIAVAMGEYMYVLAGDDGGFSVNSSVVERFNVSSIFWKPPLYQDHHLPGGYSRMAFASDGEILYSFGGGFTGGQRCNTLYEINMTSRDCRELRVTDSAVLPRPRVCSQLVYLNQTLISYGGWTDSGASDELFKFDLNKSEGIIITLLQQ